MCGSSVAVERLAEGQDKPDLGFLGSHSDVSMPKSTKDRAATQSFDSI